MIEIKDERCKKIIKEYSDGVLNENQFIAQMIELINTITDERDAYIEKVKKKEKSTDDD